MNKILIGLIIISYGTLFTSCDKKEDAGPTITVSKNLGDFNELELDGSMELQIVEGMSDDIRITAPDNLQKYIEAYVFSNRLMIDERDNDIKNSDVRIEISETALSKIILDGSGAIYGDSIYSDFILLRMKGSGSINLPVICERLEAKVNGSGRIKIFGEAENVDVDIDGSGLIDVKNVEAADASARIDGSGSIDIYANTSIFARISGSGAIRYWGEPETVDTNVSGSGAIVRMN